jgi:hypothetical protein
MRSLTHRPRKRLLPTAGLGALLVLALGASPAAASDTYNCTGGSQSATVPAGAVSASVILKGAAGNGGFGNGGFGAGRGASINFTMPVSAGQNLGVNVGCQSGYGGGGSSGGRGGPGGGASTIRLNGVLAVEAGGGGGGGGQTSPDSPGGGGGDADSDGGNGGAGAGVNQGTSASAGQGGARGNAGGRGGIGGQSPIGNGDNGGAGTFFGLGGAGGAARNGGDVSLTGGGGGGGYFGGGGGGGSSSDVNEGGGGGGGGGSSYVNVAGGVNETSASAIVTSNGSATVTYNYPAAVRATPDTVEFGKVLSTPGHSSTRTVTLTDVGAGDDGPVTLGAVLIGAGGSSFAVTGDSCSGQTLTAGRSCSVQVAYTPVSGSETDESSTLVFASDSQSGAVAARLDATAILPADMAVTPSSHALDFGDVATASAKTLQVTVYNTGDERLNLSAPGVLGVDADEFSVVAQQNFCPAQLAAGGSCSMQVQFAPSRVAAAHATLRLTSSNADANPTMDVALTGTGTAPATPPTGPQGPSGNDGANGHDGANGNAGANGTNGTGINGVDGRNGAKGDTGATGPPATPAKAPALSAVALRSRALSACLGCRSTGLLLSYKLARAGAVHLTLQRKSVHGWVPAGAETVAVSAGRHELALGNRFAGHTLRGGNYRLVVQSQNGASRSKPVTLNFRIVASRAGKVAVR